MTVSVTFDGSVIDTADVAANWTAVKITSGGGGPTAVATGLPYEGLDNVTCRSDNKKVYMYTDIGAGNELDFTAGGNAEGDLFYIWVNFLASPLLNTQAGGGLGIFMESRTPSSSVYSLWYFEGRDTYTGGWLRLAIDPNKTPSETSGGGSFDPTAVRYFGAFAYNNQDTAKYDNFVVDQCAHGKGLIVTGTSTLGLVEELLADEEVNRHGVVTKLNKEGTAAALQGKLILGDNVGTNATSIIDENSKLFVAEPLYYETALQASCPLDFAGIDVVGNGTGATSVIIGQPVGSDQGRNGMSIVGNDTYNVSLNFDDGSVNTSEWYGCSFENISGLITMGNNTSHKFFGDSFTSCSQVDPQGGVQIKNLTLVGTIATDAGLLWNDNIDITDSSFIANTSGAAIEMPSDVNTPFDYTSLTFSGNTFDVNNTSSGAITVNKLSGSNPATSTGSAVTFSASFTLTLNGLVDTSRVLIVNSVSRTVLFDQTVSVSGTLTYGHGGGEEVDILVYHNDYKIDASNVYDLTLDNADQTVKFSQSEDLFYLNP